ncbi:Histidine kinase osmosensor [Aspergillus fumigatus]
MPNLDGLESTRLIRGMGYSAPIVALSAFSEESNIKDCMDSGMDMFISKPIRRPALKQVLNRSRKSRRMRKIHSPGRSQ